MAQERDERQGLLVEEDALHDAEAACLADEDARARPRSVEPSPRPPARP